MGYNCKQVVAQVLAWMAGQPSAAGGRDAVAARVANLLRRNEPQTDSAPLFILSPAGARGLAYRVEFLVAKRKLDGDWGKGRIAYLPSIRNPWSHPAYLQPVDTEAIACLEVMVRGRSTDTIFSGAAGYFAIGKIIEIGRAFLGRELRGPLTWGEERNLNVEWKRSDGLFRLVCQPAGGGVALEVKPPCYLDPVNLCAGPLCLPEGFDNVRLYWLRRAPVIDEGQAAELSRKLALTAPYIPTPHRVDYHDCDQPPQPWLSVSFDPQRADLGSAELRFVYDTLVIRADDPKIVCSDSEGRLVRVHRRFDDEKRALARLAASGLEPAPQGAWHFWIGERAGRLSARDAWLSWLYDTLPELKKWAGASSGRAFPLRPGRLSSPGCGSPRAGSRSSLPLRSGRPRGLCRCP